MDLTVIRCASDGTFLRHGCGIYVFRLISVHSVVDFRCVFESKYLTFSIDLENFP